MYCEICNADNLRDYPLCVACEGLRHYTDRDCRCESCANPEYFPLAVRTRFPNLVLIAKSTDPAGHRRVETLGAITPAAAAAIIETIRQAA